MECAFTEIFQTEFKVLERKKYIEGKLQAEEFVKKKLTALKFEKLVPVTG
jgi:hypothetical protein